MMLKIFKVYGEVLPEMGLRGKNLPIMSKKTLPPGEFQIRLPPHGKKVLD